MDKAEALEGGWSSDGLIATSVVPIGICISVVSESFRFLGDIFTRKNSAVTTLSSGFWAETENYIVKIFSESSLKGLLMYSYVFCHNILKVSD